MRRYFYTSNPVLSKWLQKNSLLKSYEDDRYRMALLTAYRNGQRNLEELREKILNMTINEQEKYSNNMHIEQLFTHFHAFHRYSRGREMIVDAHSSHESTALVDPDKFPIWDLKKYTPIYQSLWSHFLAQLRYDIGFQPIIRESQVQHIAGGRGVYLIMSSFRRKIEVGDFLGLVPGRIYANYDDFKTIYMKNRKDYHRIPQHLHFPSGKILVLGDVARRRQLPYGLSQEQEQAQTLVDATYHNPFAVGHMINHPPPGYEPNVCFSEISLSPKYFPRHLLRYLPYQDYSTTQKEITLFGIFALKQIQHKEELFVNYNQSHIYPIDDIPEWLIQPAYFSPIFGYLKKRQYELTQSGYWKFMERRALEKNKDLLERYEKMKIARPDRVQFSDGERTYHRLKLRIEDENQYENI